MKQYMSPLIVLTFRIQRVIARGIAFPHQPPTRGSNTVSAAKTVLPRLATIIFCYWTGNYFGWLEGGVDVSFNKQVLIKR